ncbi:ABC transporter ATP-binding protein [Cohnella sp. JJ-181]|uniref:ABC transporter ATP-binding protein n=1 Tax=Cohnella rhizoplanae TaxID=2974897 RepID=UPI0022FF97AF|nr:ABC transporter ATP-binding protein [Cohnella sp. JJ-181]CAI6082027.1 Vitamin B12 import ATP-binding protein BtuD [Cohnella sp. JJ-181]
MIIVSDLSKVYKIYNSANDRIKEVFFGKRKSYHSEFHALKNVSFEVNQGETVGIVGRNGSGKSTLLKIITGVLNATSGTVNVNGKVSAILELGAGFNVEYTGIENIYLNGTIEGKSKKEMDEVIHKIIEFADIGEHIHQPVKTYSSGMFARLAFAVAINVKPDILIVDEALAVGDMKFQAKCFKKFEELKKENVTILFVGHDVSSIRKFCDKALWMHQGKLISFGDTLQVTAEYMEFMNSDEMLIEQAIPQEKDSDFSEHIHEVNNYINRWGSNPNVIKKVMVINEKGKETTLINFGETIRVRVIYDLPPDLKGHISVAISLKNTMGLDLVVYTTMDDDQISNKEIKSKNEVTFEFVNYLTNGDFILVVAVEDRNSIQPSYYDYIEGATYLKSVTPSQIFGIIHPPVQKYLRK